MTWHVGVVGSCGRAYCCSYFVGFVLLVACLYAQDLTPSHLTVVSWRQSAAKNLFAPSEICGALLAFGFGAIHVLHSDV